MADFTQTIAEQGGDLSQEEQLQAGKPLEGAMDAKPRDYLKQLMALVDSGEIDPFAPKTCLKMDVYEKMPEELQDKTDLALSSLATELQRIVEFYKSEVTPDESPQLQTMIEGFRQTKQCIEKDHDVFKF